MATHSDDSGSRTVRDHITDAVTRLLNGERLSTSPGERTDWRGYCTDTGLDGTTCCDAPTEIQELGNIDDPRARQALDQGADPAALVTVCKHCGELTGRLRV